MFPWSRRMGDAEAGAYKGSANPGDCRRPSAQTGCGCVGASFAESDAGARIGRAFTTDAVNRWSARKFRVVSSPADPTHRIPGGLTEAYLCVVLGGWDARNRACVPWRRQSEKLSPSYGDVSPANRRRSRSPPVEVRPQR